ncbi:hypothetical protein bplSymb_SCF15101P001 [Bathymodiolus platifrons methanotrophic gill symbiont]|uniref:hypothetical protein n=1 Tax=Bathymodiolus platifrons methanotrophic gill symbiont TaxID=113268 RepID=UPI000B421B16|nr:hypothetical protein [Bathymodiolus platifrons methanotrophic gill symbiont]GAW87734.1 hypothetical protein bplSymb_SCF15101P001 [Bathymodiolus platifrons methanotrophic gill symbiont]GFO76500.1 hypothetical protein BPLS_P4316 [Bathymodiolus platifrons methanotrophic gill symbiont]
MNNKIENIRFLPGDIISTTTNLIQAGKAAKDFLDGEHLCISASNYCVDLLILDSFICDDMVHSSRSVPHKDILFKNEIDSGMFVVNTFNKSKSSFLYLIELGKDQYSFLINYNWDTSSKGSGSIILTGKGLEVRRDLVFYKRAYITEENLDFRVTVFATGGFLQMAIIPPRAAMDGSIQ